MTAPSEEPDELLLPHIGWLVHESGDDVARYLREGWFEFVEQAFWWLYLRPGDTVIDCGAHVGLFTLLAAHAVGPAGRVIAIEPHPMSATLLRRNVESAGARNVEVIDAAASCSPGTLTLHAGTGRAAAYSSCVANLDDAVSVETRAVTIDEIVRERGIQRIALLKIDVEGAELDVWQGCAGVIAAHALGLAMLEFTEANQHAAGRSTLELADACESAGFALHRFDPSMTRMLPAHIDAPVQYENLLAVHDIDAVNRRLHQASPRQQRVAHEVLLRGEACFAQMKRGADSDHYRVLVADLHQRMEDALRQAGELSHARERMLAYARRVNRILDSGPGRLARRLHLVSPMLVDMVKRDVRLAGVNGNGSRGH